MLRPAGATRKTGSILKSFGMDLTKPMKKIVWKIMETEMITTLLCDLIDI